jgi:hypothetical protein
MPMQFLLPGRRLPAAAATLALLASGLLLSCSDDPETPLGSGSDLIGSTPGAVFQDTIDVFDDQVYAYNTLISSGASMSFGRQDGYTHTMIIDFNYNGASDDVNRVVNRAEMRLVAADISGTFPGRFFRMNQRYAPNDSVPSLDTLSVIVDPNSGMAERNLQSFPTTYPIPPELLQGWVRGDTARAAIAVVYTDDMEDRLAEFATAESTTRPWLEAFYTDGTSRRFFARADGTFMRPTVATPTLVVADGYVRRIYFRARLEDLAPQSAIHTARVRFHIVPGSINVGTDLIVYVPDSPDPAKSGFRSGQGVTFVPVTEDDAYVEFPLTNSIFLMLQGTLPDNGFVIRMNDENSELRQVEFYDSSAPDSLRPRVYITSSTPADYHP